MPTITTCLENDVTLHIKVAMPKSGDMSRRARAITALGSKTNKPFRVHFVEANGLGVDCVNVECHNKGVGVKTLCRWTVAVRVALKRNQEQ